MYANGNSFGAANSDLGANAVAGVGALRWPVPTWRFGLRHSDDRGSI